MKKLFSVIFVGLLLIPAGAWLIDFDAGIQAERTGYKRPLFNPRALLERSYYQSFDHYFNDNFSLRSPLLLKKRWLDFQLFRMTDIESVHIGSEGWLYNRQTIEDHLKIACRHEAEVAWKVLELHALDKIIRASGRQFFFMVIPNKATIYPEYVGFSPQESACNSSRLDLLIDTIMTYPLEGFVGLDSLFWEAKAKETLLYDRTATCWNKDGAKIAAETIWQHIFEDHKSARSLYLKPAIVEGDRDLNRQMMGLALSEEDQPATHIAVSEYSDLPTGIIYSDECIRNLLPYMQQMFSELDVIQTDLVPSKQYGESLQDHDVILIARTESELSALNLDLDQIFSIFDNATSLHVRLPIDLERVVPLANTSLNISGKGLQIKSIGAQSVFEIKSIPASEEDIFRVLMLSIEIPHNDIMTVKYLSGLPYITTKSLKTNMNAVYLPLPFQKSVSLHIYPGKKAGVSRIHSIELLEFPEQPLKETLTALIKQPEIKPQTTQFDTNSDIKISATAANKIDQADNAIMKESTELAISTAEENADKKANSGNEQRNVTEELTVIVPATKAVIENIVPQRAASDDALTREDRLLELAAVPTEIPATIAVTDFKDGRIFQRKGQSVEIVVSGSYMGNIEAIEARVVLDSTNEEVVPWTIIDDSPRNGIYVGSIPAVPQGGWYNLQVRSTKDHSVSAHGLSKWGVGILVACLGQSNMKEWFYTGKDLKANSLVRKFTDKGWSEIGKRGNAAIAFGNRLTERMGIPLGLLDYSKNGSGLRKEANWGTGYWENTVPGSIYNRFLAGVSEVGGALEFVIWIQGEADAARETVTEEEYQKSLESFITNQLRADIDNSSDKENLPVLIVMMVKRPGGEDEPHQAIRNAQKYVTEKVDDCYLAATTLDLKNRGKQHLSPSAYILLGNRVAQTVLYALGEETYHRGPRVTDVSQIDSHTLEIRLQHRGGNNITPASKISGWDVLVDGKFIPIVDAYRHDPQTIRISLKNPLTEKAIIRYLFGAMPDTSRPVLDNSAMSLPLEEYQSEIN